MAEERKTVSIVRRLTPLECERLMGFPDGYTDIGPNGPSPKSGNRTPDSCRYRACGNSWGVNCAAWVAGRIHGWDLAHGGRGITNYATVCSGVEAQSLALKAAGIVAKAVFFSEIDTFPSRVLAHHYPDVPNLGDMTKIRVTGNEITNGTVSIPMPDRIDLFSGGSPCQDFSVAGKRAGGERGSGTRSSLCWTWLDLVGSLRPTWVVWENVPGCLSSGKPAGSDFAKFASAVSELGYCCAWRTLDVQYTRVEPFFPYAIPQRRRRVWLVGRLGTDGFDGGLPPAAEVLFDGEGVHGDSPPVRSEREGLACGFGRGGLGTDPAVE